MFSHLFAQSFVFIETPYPVLNIYYPNYSNFGLWELFWVGPCISLITLILLFCFENFLLVLGNMPCSFSLLALPLE